MNEIIHIKSIAEINKIFGMPSPKRPLVIILWAKDMPDFTQYFGVNTIWICLPFSLKDGMEGSLGYGRNRYYFRTLVK